MTKQAERRFESVEEVMDAYWPKYKASLNMDKSGEAAGSRIAKDLLVELKKTLGSKI